MLIVELEPHRILRGAPRAALAGPHRQRALVHVHYFCPLHDVPEEDFDEVDAFLVGNVLLAVVLEVARVVADLVPVVEVAERRLRHADAELLFYEAATSVESEAGPKFEGVLGDQELRQRPLENLWTTARVAFPLSGQNLVAPFDEPPEDTVDGTVREAGDA